MKIIITEGTDENMSNGERHAWWCFAEDFIGQMIEGADIELRYNQGAIKTTYDCPQRVLDEVIALYDDAWDEWLKDVS